MSLPRTTPFSRSTFALLAAGLGSAGLVACDNNYANETVGPVDPIDNRTAVVDPMDDPLTVRPVAETAPGVAAPSLTAQVRPTPELADADLEQELAAEDVNVNIEPEGQPLTDAEPRFNPNLADAVDGVDREYTAAESPEVVDGRERLAIQPAATAPQRDIVMMAHEDGDHDHSQMQSASGDMLTIVRVLPDQVYAGSDLNYQLRVTNNSEMSLHEVTIFETLQGATSASGEKPTDPPLAGYANVTDLSNGSEPQPSVYYLGMLEPGQTRDIQVRASAVESGEVRSCVWADFNAAKCATIPVVKPELEFVHMFVDAEGNEVTEAYRCDPVFSAYLVTNLGTGETQPVTVEEELPDGITSTAARNGMLSMQTPGLANAEVFTSELVPLDLEEASGTIYARAVASTKGAGSVADSSQLTILEPALDLRVDAPSETYVGRDVDISVTVSNPSDDPVRDVAVAMDLPADADRVSVSAGDIGYADGAFDVGTLEGGQSRTFDVTFTPTSVGSFEAEAVATGYCVPRVAKQISTEFTGVPALQLEVVDTTDPVEIGGETIYEVRILNEGTAKDMNIRMQGELPENFSFVSAAGDVDVTASGRDLEFSSIDEIGPGEEIRFNITAKADGESRGNLELNVRTDNLKTPLLEREPTSAY